MNACFKHLSLIVFINLRLNPFDCDLMAQRYHDAIEMSDEERKQMHDDVVNVVKMFSLSKSVREICESIDFQSEVA